MRSSSRASLNLTQHNSPAANDVAAVVDVSASVERKMTLGKMVQGGVSVTSGGGLTKTNANSTGSTNLAYTPGTDAEMVDGHKHGQVPVVSSRCAISARPRVRSRSSLERRQ